MKIRLLCNKQEYENNPQNALIAADGDAYVICPSRKIARLVSAAAPAETETTTITTAETIPTYSFEFAHFKSHNCDAAIPYLVLANNSDFPGWASHGMDVSYIFGATYASLIDGLFLLVFSVFLFPQPLDALVFNTKGTARIGITPSRCAPICPTRLW